jgi:hypothetical protein
MKDQSNNQPGAQRHPEGGYGEAARKANLDRLQTSQDAGDDDDAAEQPRQGRHKIYEDRQQHDEADKNSEKNRLARDRDRADND